MLGFRTLSVFSEFLLKLQSTDPRELIRLSNIRAEAIAMCVSRVLEEGETLFSGWTLFSPVALNTKLGEKFEEKVLLLVRLFLFIFGLCWVTKTSSSVSGRLIYHCKGRTSLNATLSLRVSQSFDYNLGKVKVSTRVPLQDIVVITKGTPNHSWIVSSFTFNIGAYIISPLEEASRDPVQNAGFVVEWRNTSRQRTRVTSYSLRNSVDLPSSPSPSGANISLNNASKFTARGNPHVSPTRSISLTPLALPSVSQRQITYTSSTTVATPNTMSPPLPSSTSASTISATKYRQPSLLRSPTATATARLSRLLSSTALPTPAPTTETSGADGASDVADSNTTNFAAFKALPIDRTRREVGGSAFVEPSAPDGFGANTCQEAVDLMVDAIVSACRDAHAHARTHAHAYDSAISGLGKGKGDVDVVPSVRNEDIVRSVSFSFFLSHVSFR